jgi:hypothetical protein
MLGYFSPKVRFVLISTKNGFGFILGDFFTNSSGHPMCEPATFVKIGRSIDLSHWARSQPATTGKVCVQITALPNVCV